MSNLGDGGSTLVNWQVEDGAGFVTIDETTHGGVYLNFTTETLNITDATGLDGYFYRMRSTTTECIAYTTHASLTTTPVPDITDLRVSVDDICLGFDLKADLLGPAITDGDYLVSYKISGETNIPEQVAQVKFSSGVSSFIINSTMLTNAGNHSLEIVEMSFANSSSCAIEVIGVSDPFIINLAPDITNLVLSMPDVCIGHAGVGLISGQLSAGNYNFKFNLSGANIASNQNVVVDISPY